MSRRSDHRKPAVRAGDGIVYGHGREITEEKPNTEALAAAENALRQSRQMKVIGQLTGGVAHDFNNVPRATIANLDLLGRHPPPDPKADRLIDGAIRRAGRGAPSTQRLLAFAPRRPPSSRP